MTAEQWLADLEDKAMAATPGNRYVVETDDNRCMSAVYVATTPEDAAPGEKPENVIAVTLLQSPPVACISDMKWDENAALIAATDPATVLRLVGMVRWLADNIPGVVRPCAGYSRKCFLGDITKCEGDSDEECWIEAAYIATEKLHG